MTITPAPLTLEELLIQDVLPGFQLTAKELFDSLIVD
jgi:hypothetical protein